ncbi:MAG: TonB-dependent receptor plug domain-containing protein, partial [Calditrichota bacterium]
MLLCTLVLRGQSTIRISGTVYDASSAIPVADAQIVVLNTPYEAWTDADGRYVVEGISAGRYQIQCRRLGYSNSIAEHIDVHSDQKINHNFYLNALPVTIDSVNVLSEAELLSAVEGEGVVISRTDIERYRSLGLNKMLQQVAGVQVDAAGGSGSRAVIRIHGSRASQVLVLLDGQRLNDSQTGEVDLSAIPIEDIERVEVIRQGNTALYGGGAFDGVVHFHTREASTTNPSELAGYTGSFSSAGMAVNTSLTTGKAGLRLSYHQDYSRQNFPYVYEGRTETRRNSWGRNRGGMLRGSYKGKHNQLKLLIHGGKTRQGLPSFFYSEFNPYTASLQLDRMAFQLRHSWLPGLFIWQNSFSVNEANSE